MRIKILDKINITLIIIILYKLVLLDNLFTDAYYNQRVSIFKGLYQSQRYELVLRNFVIFFVICFLLLSLRFCYILTKIIGKKMTELNCKKTEKFFVSVEKKVCTVDYCNDVHQGSQTQSDSRAA